VMYDFDKIMPSLAGLSADGSYGDADLLAPRTAFSPHTAGQPFSVFLTVTARF
jgi:hypothetical protein